MFSTELFDWILFFIALFLIILCAEMLRRLTSKSAEVTRKIVHILTGVLVAMTPFMVQSKWPLVVLGILFSAIDYIAIRYGLLQGMHGTFRYTYGTVFYPIAVVVLTLLLWDQHKTIYVCAILILAISDAAAAIVGERLRRPIFLKFGPDTKTLQGSTAMFLSTFLIVIFCLTVLPQDISDLGIGRIVGIAMVVAVISTVCEAISLQGSDNLTVPLGAAFAMHYMLNQSQVDVMIFGLGMVFALFVAIVSYRLRFLSQSGAMGTFLLGVLVFGVGRWNFALPILTFFVLSSLLSKLGKKRKSKLLSVFEKGGVRDLGQVLANGGIAGLLVIFWYFFQSDLFYVLFVAALAAVTADTWATEIGVMSKAAPRSILTLKSVPMGTSGGITLVGTLGAAAGATIVGLVGLLAAPRHSSAIMSLPALYVVIFSGLVASFVDSLLGATVQAQFRCPVCNKVTEKRVHCENNPTTFFKGFHWINNDVVNAFCALSGVIMAWLLSFGFRI